MSNYIFAPMPPTQAENNLFVTWQNGFTDEELKKIEEYCDNNLTIDKATISGLSKDDDYSDIRITQTGWISLNEDTAWFYDKMAYIARALNSQFYRFDLYGFQEDFQYTVYDSNEEGHYDWHIDAGGETSVPRKLTLVLQLTDPAEYEGGDLHVSIGKEPEIVAKERGLVVAFPAFRMHKVTPVTAGVRKTIVIWIGGPQFR